MRKYEVIFFRFSAKSLIFKTKLPGNFLLIYFKVGIRKDLRNLLILYFIYFPFFFLR